MKMVILGLFLLPLASPGVAASQNWPFSHEAYPRDLLYYQNVMLGMTTNPNFNPKGKDLKKEEGEEKFIGKDDSKQDSATEQHTYELLVYGALAP